MRGKREAKGGIYLTNVNERCIFHASHVSFTSKHAHPVAGLWVLRWGKQRWLRARAALGFTPSAVTCRLCWQEV